MASVLVIDDDADIRGLLKEVLERAGHAVTEAADGREGLRVFHGEQPDLVILDVAMPALDGWQTLERIRELSTVPVVMLSAGDQELDKVRGLRGGADDYVTKPFGPQELLARVDGLLRKGRLEADSPETYADGFLTIVASSEPYRRVPLRSRAFAASVTGTTFRAIRPPVHGRPGRPGLERRWGSRLGQSSRHPPCFRV